MTRPAAVARMIGFQAALCILIGGTVLGQRNSELRPADAFSGIADQGLRSRALFEEAAKVLTHPRCMNCHPADDHPRQTDNMSLHVPRVTRGAAGFGIGGNTCSACHTENNVTLQERASYRSIPGHPRWALAPIEMAWQGKSLKEICEQIKDPQRNGNKTLDMLYQHMAEDDLVGWGWKPGDGRDPAPGDQKVFGELIKAWIQTGAECP